VGPRAGLDVCEKSRPHRNFFYFHIFLWTNNNIFTIRSPDRPARSQSLYQLSYPARVSEGSVVEFSFRNRYDWLFYTQGSVVHEI
jgi:hypothetical protein